MDIDSQRINPGQLGARPAQNIPNFWTLNGPGMEEMAITCLDSDRESFVASIQIAALMSEEQSYQLAVALTLNYEHTILNGGAIAYDVDNDNFLYCKRIDAHTLNLSSFDSLVKKVFETAALLRERLLHAQRRIQTTSMSTSETFSPWA